MRLYPWEEYIEVKLPNLPHVYARVSEIDSFIWKFKQLVHSGMNAHLDIKTEAGRAIVHLTAEVDVHVPPPQQHSRNGPSRQRRRERQAQACNYAQKAETAVEVALLMKLLKKLLKMKLKW